MSKLTIKTPGKLMVAGEYAVLEENYKSIVMAVDRYVYATIQSSDTNEVFLTDFNLNQLKWHYENKKVNIETIDPRTTFVQEAMGVALLYLEEKDIQPTSFTLTIRSELDDYESGLKYGLGSSAAVVTATISAILTMFLQTKPSKEVIFKLSSIVHVSVQGSGSGADIAASTYGGMIQYISFQANWLLQQLRIMNSITYLVDQPWPFLTIKKLMLPTKLQLCVGWTGSPASTVSLVKKINEMKRKDDYFYNSFLEASTTAVSEIIDAMKTDNKERFLKGIKYNRKALAQLGKDTNVPIETPLLALLSDLATKWHGQGKLSGAGGGDCGIAFLPQKINKNDFYMIWEQKGIQVLDVNIAQEGTEVSSQQ